MALALNNPWRLICVVMLAKERHGKHKKVDRKTYFQVTETRYKWTWLNSKLVNRKMRVQWGSDYLSTMQVVSYMIVSCGSGQLLWCSVDVYLWRRVSPLCREYNNIPLNKETKSFLTVIIIIIMCTFLSEENLQEWCMQFFIFFQVNVLANYKNTIAKERQNVIKWRHSCWWRKRSSEDIILVVGQWGPLKALFLLVITWIHFTQFENWIIVRTFQVEDFLTYTFEKGINLLIPPSLWLNIITTVLLQG